MWVIIPVKALGNAKRRLSSVMTPGQRARFCRLMLEDILETIGKTTGIQGVTVVSSDQNIHELAQRYGAMFLLTEGDSGFSEDAMEGAAALPDDSVDTVAIIPADVPQVQSDDLVRLQDLHRGGITLCPAVMDGGTNALVVDLPLPIPFMFGVDSLRRYREEAARREIPVTIDRLRSLERDIDRPDDLAWLKDRPGGGRAWSWLQAMDIKTGNYS